MKVINIAAPYNAPTREEIRLNVHNAGRLGAKLMDRGWVPLVPHAIGRVVSKYIDRTNSDWILNDLYPMERCDAVIFSVNWEKSKGCRTEHSYALSKNIKIYYEVDGIPSSIP
jgi:hypothetical protein